MRLPLLLALILAVAGCREEEQQQQPPPAAGPAAPRNLAQIAEGENLLNIGFGAAVVSRTGELTFESSAIRAIDGDASSAWSSPPSDLPQTLVFSLPSLARIESVGVLTTRRSITWTSRVTIELSTDGIEFAELRAPALKPTDQVQISAIPPADARYVRLTVEEGGSQVAMLRSVHARGRWLAPPSAASLAGCWTINGFPSRFVENGGRVSGVVGGEHPIHVDGGAEAAVYRLAWARGPEWGYAFVTLTPDGSRLSGLTWHEEATAQSFGTSWYGERMPCPLDPPTPRDVLPAFLGRAGWYPLFSLHFDERDRMVGESSQGAIAALENVLRRLRSRRVRIVAREYRGATAEENRRRAEARLQSLRAALQSRGVDLSRIDFVALGSASPRRPTEIQAMKLLYGVVEIELPEAARTAF